MVLPVLSMLLVGILFGGITFINYVELVSAVEVGARTLAATGAAQKANACTAANTALTNANGNLTVSQIWIVPETFPLGGACGDQLQSGQAAVVSATYPCNLPIPFTGINLCPVQGTTSTTSNANCPYSTYCISATTTVYIE